MGVPVPGMLEERLLQAERLTNTAAWNDQKLAEVVAGIQQVLEEIPPPSPEGGGCNPTLTVHCLYPDGTIDPGATVTLTDPSTGFTTIAVGTADSTGTATFTTGLANRTVRATITDPRGCFAVAHQDVVFVCTSAAITLQLLGTSRTFTITVQTCGSVNALTAGASVSIYRPDGTLVASGTTGSTPGPNFGVATLTTATAWQKGTYSVIVSGAGLVTSTTTYSITTCTNFGSTIHAPNSTYYYKFLVNACNTCPQPNMTVTLKDSTGAAIGTAVTDSTGTAIIPAPTTASTPLSYTVTNVDFVTQSAAIGGGATLSYVPGTGCTLTISVTMQTLANHYCYGGVQPPGATGPVPGAVFVTLPGDTAVFGTMAGTTVTCNYLDINASNIRYRSACTPVTIASSSDWAQVEFDLPTFNCSVNTSGVMTFTVNAFSDCRAGGTISFSGSSVAGKIWKPISCGNSYTNSRGTFSWSVSE